MRAGSDSDWEPSNDDVGMSHSCSPADIRPHQAPAGQSQAAVEAGGNSNKRMTSGRPPTPETTKAENHWPLDQIPATGIDVWIDITQVPRSPSRVKPFAFTL